MRNPARLAAALSGRPLLLREASVPALAQLLGMQDHERGSPVATFFGRARRALAQGRKDAHRGDADAPRTEPEARAPRWVGDPDALGYGWVLKDGVGIIEIDGPLLAEGCGWGDVWYHGYDTLRTAYEEMFADARVGAIWEVVRSPGGVVDAGLPELAALKRANRAAAGGKPIHAFLRDGYSAAYWEPSAADHIDAARESGVGSIGAVVTWCGMSGMLEKDGLEIRAFKFGARKTDGSPFEPLSATAEDALQAEIDQCGRWFVADVLAGRPGLTEEAVLATEAGCFFGDSDDPALSGLAHGLVDTIRSERDSFAAVRELAQARLSGTGPAPSTSLLKPASPEPSAAAPEAAPATPQETEMKRSAVIAAAKKAGLTDEQLTKLSAELPEDDKSEDDKSGADTGDEKDAPTDEDPAPEDEDEGDKLEDKEPEGEDEAAKISNSKEAKAHPALALAAIGSKVSYAQFRAMASASPAPNKAAGRLAEAMKGGKRLGADAGKSEGGMSAAMRARADRNRGSASA